MHSQPAPPQRAPENKVLAAFGNAKTPGFYSQLERILLSQGEVIYEPGARIDYVYFPETAVCSMLATMADGDTVEVGPVGDEGMVGLSVFFGAPTSGTQVLVHVAGTAMRLKAEVLRKELKSENSALTPLLLRYTQMLLAMTGLSAACYQLHCLDKKFARWLLTMHDYVGAGELRLTHELIALTLGVRRAGISESANSLKSAGIIDYERGDMRVIDRRGLEAKACECYRAVKDEYDLLYAELPKLAT